MSRPCGICVHVDRDAIDAAILRGDILREVCKRHNLAERTLYRHSAHIAAALAVAREARVDSAGENVVTEIRQLRDKARDLGDKAEKSGDLRTALVAVRELTRIAELVARLTLEARDDTQEDRYLVERWLAAQADVLCQSCRVASADLARTLAGSGLPGDAVIRDPSIPDRA